MSQPRPRIDIYSHHFTVTGINDSVRRAMTEFVKGLMEWELVRVPPFTGKPRYIKQVKRVYASATEDRKEARFIINHLDGFKAQLYANGTDPETGVDYVVHPLYEPEKISLELISGKVLRDVQVPVVDYLSKKDEIRSKVVTAPTGTGKGIMSITSLVNLGLRTVVVVKAKYIEKWAEELEQEIALMKGDLLVIRGSDQLISLMNMALEGELKAKIIIIGNRTLQNYVKGYERDPCFKEMYPIDPEHLYEKLKVGVRLIDEVHEDFHFNVKQDTYTHVPYSISLSATLDADQEILNQMYRAMWPIATRGPEVPQERYIAATCLWYSIDRIDRVRYLNPKKQYSHTEFEKSLMRNKVMLDNYLRMIELVVRSKIGSDYQPGQKMLIFCGLVEMCTLVRDHLSKLFQQFKVGRYVGEDDWSELHNNDIVVSTIGSAGTAVDVANLRYVLMTTALSNKQTNIQVVGRLRKLKDYPDVTPEFMFLSCRDIGKHCEYAMAKKAKLNSKVKLFNQTYLPIRV